MKKGQVFLEHLLNWMTRVLPRATVPTKTTALFDFVRAVTCRGILGWCDIIIVIWQSDQRSQTGNMEKLQVQDFVVTTV